MQRILLACSGTGLRERIRKAFKPESGFKVCGEAKNDAETLRKATKLLPDLLILEMRTHSKRSLETAETLKRKMPKVAVFLIIEEANMETEREALHREIDAVFKKEDDLTSLVMNARAICGLV